MTIRHALTAAAGNTGPAPAPTDPQFNYVSMLLHGDGTNGAQNNTFVPTPITAPASGYYAGYFDGNGDYLTVPDNAAFNFGSGDLTVEMWLYPTAPGQSGYTFIYTKPNGTGYSGVAIIQDPSSYAIKLYCSSTGSSWDLVNGATIGTLPANTWSHVAVSRSGANMLTFLNGVLGSTTAISTSSLLSTTSAVHVGSSLGNANTFFTGYVSNLRVVKGTAVYTANFTPPTAPLTAISGTSLLTCMSGTGSTFSDLSTNNFTITANGNAAVTGVATTPPGAAPFSASLPGSPSYVTVGGGMPSGAGTAFTMECWIYITDLSGYNAITRGDSSPRLDWGVDTSGSLKLDSVTVANICSSATGVITANTWYHVAVTRSTGNVYKLWANGTNVATSSAFGTSMTANTTIGYSSFSSSHFFKGRISNFRVATSEVYTANFAPPSAPLTAISGTSLLTFQNATFLDNSPNAYSVTANGSAAITSSYILPAITRNGNTTQGSLSPYGSQWSNWFSGSSSWLNTPNNAALAMGTGDFTWECFVYLTQANSYGCIFDSRVGGTSGGFFVGYDVSPTTFMVYISSVVISTATLPALNTWQHICLVRQGTTLSLFINGARVGTATNSTNLTNGVMNLFGNGNPAFGYLSNVRIVKGTAVYNPSNTTLTVPTTPLTAISGTSLLTCQSNRFIDNSANNFTITRNGDVRVTKEAPFLPTAAYSTSTIGGSGYFDGTGDYLSLTTNSAFDFGTGNFTIEFWFYSTVNSASYGGFVVRGTQRYVVSMGSSGNTPEMWINDYSISGPICASATNICNGAWNHVAAVRNGNVFTMYVNGVAGGTSNTWTGSVVSSTAPMWIGNDPDFTSRTITGYMSNVRVVKGTAVYTANFTPPTAPLTAPLNTSLLLNFTNAGIFDNAAENDLETVGNAQISTSVKKYGTGSLAFDGTGGYLSVPMSQGFNFGSGDFTVEFWLYAASVNSVGVCAFPSNSSNYASVLVYGSGTTTLAFYSSSAGSSWDVAGGVTMGTITTNSWNHVAVCRQGTSIRLFVNGVLGNTVTYSGSFTGTYTNSFIGDTPLNSPLNGYIDDVRITKGYARYTANFTPPTAAFPDQ